jgi:hypothetical protein
MSKQHERANHHDCDHQSAGRKGQHSRGLPAATTAARDPGRIPPARAIALRGRGPRLADFAYLIWGTGSWNPRRPDQERIDAAVNAYRRHVEPTDDELERLEAVMYIRTLYLTCFSYRRAVTDGIAFREWWFIRPRDYYSLTAAAVRAAFRR